MRGSLLVLDVGFLVPLDSAVGELGILDVVLAVVELSAASPVPVHSSHELESGDLLVSEVGNDLEHLATIAIKTEDLEVKETRTVDAVLKVEGTGCQASNKPLSVLDVVPEVSLHFI